MNALDTEIKSQITDMYLGGKPVAEIARVTGVPYSSVYFWTVNQGKPAEPAPPWSFYKLDTDPVGAGPTHARLDTDGDLFESWLTAIDTSLPPHVSNCVNLGRLRQCFKSGMALEEALLEAGGVER